MKGSERRRESISRIPVHIYIHISRGSFRGESRTGRMEGQFEVDDGKRVGSLIQIGEETPEGRRKRRWKGERRKMDGSEVTKTGGAEREEENETFRGPPFFQRRWREARKKNEWGGFRALMT